MKVRILAIVADALIGVLLAVGFFATGDYGLSDENWNSYERAIALQPSAAALGFTDFYLEDYPVAFYQDGKEYVCHEGKVTSRKPILDILAGTAYLVDDHYEVFVPDIRDTALLTGSISEEERLFAQTSTIWHEALHAWQQTYFIENLNRFTLDIDIADAESLMASIDENDAYRAWFTREMELLNLALDPTLDAVERDALLTQWQQHQTGLDRLGLTNTQLQFIDYYQISEGVALYVESNIYLASAGEKAYNEKYRNSSFSYTNGTWKYYQCGMLKCLLLDEMAPGWQESFDCSQSMTSHMTQTME